MDEVFIPDTNESMNMRKMETLHHIARELEGVIQEYRVMRCDSLERRMFATVDRYQARLRDCSPEVSLEQWNERRRVEHEKWEKFEADAKDFDLQTATGADLDKIAHLVGVSTLCRREPNKSCDAGIPDADHFLKNSPPQTS